MQHFAGYDLIEPAEVPDSPSMLAADVHTTAAINRSAADTVDTDGAESDNEVTTLSSNVSDTRPITLAQAARPSITDV